MSGTVLGRLQGAGVEIPAPSMVYVGPEVVPERIEAGCVLLPGAQLHGARTLIGRGARIGTGGPALVRNCAVGRDVELSSGTFEDSVFLEGASFGPSGFARGGTLLEEGARAAHCVGTKQTILLPFATLGSVINFCDCLLAGGTGPDDHSEVGSGFIHFNFSPSGARGDKATASLFGDVVSGAFLREKRIFLGGNCGAVGPIRIGFGTVLAAGSVYRRDRGEDLLVYGEQLPSRERPFDPRVFTSAAAKVRKNLEFMAELVALRSVYSTIRRTLAEGDAFAMAVVEAGELLIDGGLRERVKQLDRLSEDLLVSAEVLATAGGRAGGDEVTFQRSFRQRFVAAKARLADFESRDQSVARDLVGSRAGRRSYLEWVRCLTPEQASAGRAWLRGVAERWLTDPSGAGALA